MLYSSKREIHSMAQDPEREQREHDKEHDSDHSSCCADDTEISKPDPLEGLDEETKICFQVIRDGVDDICSKTKCDVLISVFFFNADHPRCLKCPSAHPACHVRVADEEN